MYLIETKKKLYKEYLHVTFITFYLLQKLYFLLHYFMFL